MATITWVFNFGKAPSFDQEKNRVLPSILAPENYYL
jgi:hypothetical protein